MRRPPAVDRILETCLYVDDLPRACAFYQRVFDLPRVMGDDRLIALKVGERQVLLLFKRGASLQGFQSAAGRTLPHDGAGPLHFAFLIPAGAIPQWETWLAECGLEVEGRIDWPGGSTSLYFRDPDGHLAEVATPGLWGIS